MQSPNYICYIIRFLFEKARSKHVLFQWPVWGYSVYCITLLGYTAHINITLYIKYVQSIDPIHIAYTCYTTLRY